MAIEEQDETGLLKGDQTEKLIKNLHEEIATLKAQRDWYYKAWQEAERDFDRHKKGLRPVQANYRAGLTRAEALKQGAKDEKGSDNPN